MLARSPPGCEARPSDPSSAQARMVRRATEHAVIRVRNMMSNHTDTQDKYCGRSNDIHPIQRAAKGRHLCMLALNRVNVIAVTTILVLHVGVIGHHVPCH